MDNDEFYRWLVEDLLPQCNPYPSSKSVNIMDNCPTHTKARIEEAIRAAGCEIKYLPPYSPDYNPIELTFGVLKSWIRRNYTRVYPSFEGDFETFLKHAVIERGCDQHAEAHFQHCEYLADIDFDRLIQLRIGRVEEGDDAEEEGAEEVEFEGQFEGQFLVETLNYAD